MADHIFDNPVDEEIYACLNLAAPKSFFLFAGAGSGKTRSLVEVLKRFREDNIHKLRVNGQKVAIITYTNAACEEIKRRLDFDKAFVVSTIHSFSWELIKPHQHDIREWLRSNLEREIKKLEIAQEKGRAGTKAAEDRPRQIEAKRRRLNSLNEIAAFTYNPNGNNTGADSLNHAEVINLIAEFLEYKPLMRSILIGKFPILLIDESQDTKKELIEAFIKTQAQHSDVFSLGLFGDTMQRIYTDGKVDLCQDVPESWATPEKTINYRCPSRVITLINKIRSGVDRQVQSAIDDAEEGIVRLFIADRNAKLDKGELERAICYEMSEITGDPLWREIDAGNKTLTLEHHMAALRCGFFDFFNPLYKVEKLKTGLLDGSLSAIILFARKVLPLIKSYQSNDSFSVSRIVQENSTLISKERLFGSENPKAEIFAAKSAVSSLSALCEDGEDPKLIAILREIYRSKLFHIPEELAPIAARTGKHFEQGSDGDTDPVIDAWDAALQSRFSQFERYVHYISGQSSFGTHQGIKGLEFPRVMVILDDDEARGFLFSYDKLFGAKLPSDADRRNANEGKETSIDRTRRLFYVACSRAEKSLAIVAYTTDVDKVKGHALVQGWFTENEIVCDFTRE